MSDIERSHNQKLNELKASSQLEKQQLEQLLEKDRSQRDKLQVEIVEKGSTIPPLKEQIEKLKLSPKTSAIGDIKLKSEKGIDYTELKIYLEHQMWQDADKETAKVMLKVVERERIKYLRESDINYFSCEDLRTIDQLWIQYSCGKFGFSIQMEIYEIMGGTREYNRHIWNSFGEHIGWRKKGKWLNYSELTFDTNSCKAHLPSFLVFEQGMVYSCLPSLLARIAICKK